jgi:hypothetical protein
MALVLVLTGLVATVVGTWRGYASAREVLGPVTHPGDRTRTAVEATQPFHERARVRRAARSLVAAIAWLAIAMYGLFLVAAAELAR